MGRKITLLAAFSLFFGLPSLGYADCTNLGSFNHFFVQDDGSIIFYYNNVPLGTVELHDCTADSSSEIRLIKTLVCDGDHILVNGESCTLLSVKID